MGRVLKMGGQKAGGAGGKGVEDGRSESRGSWWEGC